MGRVLIILGTVALLAAAIFWRARVGDARADDPASVPPSAVEVPSTAKAATPPEPRALTFTRDSAPAGDSFFDPVVISSCTVVPGEEQEISSLVDSVLREVRVDLGSRVRPGQVLGRLDDRTLLPQVELLQIKAASRAAERIARAQYEEAAGKVRYARKANESGLRSVSELEYQAYLAQRERFAQEMAKAREERRAAAKELEKAEQTLARHTIRSGLAGEVVKVYKRTGEAVRQSEPLFRVADFSRLRVEGLCKVQQADLLRPGMHVLVEPERRGEQMTELSGHTGAVTALAVAPDGKLIASAGEDRTVILWDWPRGTRRAVLTHPAEVYAVAFAPGAHAAGYRLATGCADGQVRLWAVAARGAVDGPVALAPAHQGAVRAVAFSPDGRRCATGGEDKQAGVWDVTAGKHRYWLTTEDDGPAHQGAVTAVHFTPDGHLVTAGRDNLLKVWELGPDAARLTGSHAGRTGDVAQPGVSPDGRRLLFDHGEELRLLDRDTGDPQGALRARGRSRFQGLALFSPSGRMILTGGGNGRLQLWKAPASRRDAEVLRRAYAHGFARDSLLGLGLPGSRLAPWPVLAGAPWPRLWDLDGHEVRYFQAPNTTVITCGAFSPDEKVAFTGGTDNVVRVWALPAPAQWEQPLEAVLTFVGSQVERGTDTVRVRAELVNPRAPARRLRPGTYADLRAYPETAPEK